jgi:large conductance mechanosensitive channel
MPGGITGSVASLLDTSSRLPLAEAKKLGPVIAWGNFVTISINFLLVALVIFLVIRALAAARARFEREQKLEAAAPAVPPADVQLLTEIRDLLKSRT